LEWLRQTFSALSNPDRDVLRVLGLNYTAGHSAKKELAAQKMDFLMHWIAGAIAEDASPYTDPSDSPPPLSLEQALTKATLIAKSLFTNDPQSEKYDKDYIRKCWYEQHKSYRQSPYRGPYDPNSYYAFPVDD